MTSLCQALGIQGHGGVISIVGAGGKTSLMFSLAREISEQGQSVLTTTTTRIMMPSKAQSRHVILTPSLQQLADCARELLPENLHLTAACPRLQAHPEKIGGFSAAFIDALNRLRLFRWIIVEADGAAQKPLKVPAAHEPVIPAASSRVIGVVGLKAIGKPLQPEWVFRHLLFAAISNLAPGMPVTEDSVIQAVRHPQGIFKDSPSQAQKILFLNAAGDPHRLAAGRRIVAKMMRKAAAPGVSRVVLGSPLENPYSAEGFDMQG